MGKPDSFAFCRMHDLRETLEITPDKAYSAVIPLIAPHIYRYAVEHEDSPGSKPLLLLYTYFANDQQEKAAAIDRLGEYDKNLPTALLEATDYLQGQVASGSDPEAELLLALVCGINCDSGGLSEETKEAYHVMACRALDSYLERESTDPDFSTAIWMFLAYFCDYEKYHDEVYGSPIVGKSPFAGKDQDGNPVEKKTGTVSQPESKEKSGGCYIATAVYGSYDCPEVWTLRRFRDHRLSASWYGRAFVKAYYAASPTVVRFFGNTRAFSIFFKAKLDALVAALKEEGFSDEPYSD